MIILNGVWTPFAVFSLKISDTFNKPAAMSRSICVRSFKKNDDVNLIQGGHEMLKKRYLFVCSAVAFAIFMLSGIAFAKELSSFEELYRQIPGDNPNNSAVIDAALKNIAKTQELRENKIAVFEKPKELLVINPRFISISFDAGVKSKGVSARAKATPAVYALLFEKDTKNDLTFYKGIYLVWQGEADVETYSSLKPENICEMYRERGAEYAYLDRKTETAARPVEEIVLNGSHIKTGIVSEQFIDSAITRDSELNLILEGYVKKDVEKTKQAPDAALIIQQLEARVKELENILKNVTRRGNDIVLSGVNLVVNNGSGTVGRTNGTGNIVVGYDEPGSGSHNVLVGSKNRCSSFGSIVSGAGNTVSGSYSAVVGGQNNVASGGSSTVLGGRNNVSSGDYSSIMGGSDNKARGDYTGINSMRGRTKVNEGDNKHFQND